MDQQNRTVPEMLSALGEQIRAQRLRINMTVEEVAGRAGVSISAVSRLESGSGSSVATLVSVVQAVGRSEWLDTLQPPITISPLSVHRAPQGRQRATGTRAQPRDDGTNE